MSLRAWRRIGWAYHILFAAAVTWPIQALVNDPGVSLLGLPVQLAWAAAWVLGSLVVLWRLDSARNRESGRAAAPGSAQTGVHGSGAHGSGAHATGTAGEPGDG